MKPLQAMKKIAEKNRQRKWKEAWIAVARRDPRPSCCAPLDENGRCPCCHGTLD